MSSTTEDSKLEPGHALLSQFAFTPGYKNLNHGSFGSAPKCVIEKQREYQNQMEGKPDIFLRWTYVEKINEGRELLKTYLNADLEGLVLIENSSTGVNGVLRSIKWEEGDTILHLSTAYPMVVNAAAYLHDTQNVNILKVEITFPITSDGIVAQVEKAIQQLKAEGGKKRIRVAVFSHITSVPSIILPVQKLTSVCHDNNILVLIDGAHAPGQIPVDLTALGVDFYTANLHKWCFTPKASAFLYVAAAHRSWVAPTIISSEFKPEHSFVKNFQYTGTRDYTTLCLVPEAFAFRKRIGEERINNYMHDLAIEAGKLLSSMWNTEVLHIEDSMVGSMVNVRLPFQNPATATALSAILVKKHDTFIVIFPLQGSYWTRMSAAVYLEKSDFEWIGKLVLEILKELKEI